MPFTLAHPAIVLPLKYLPKKWISTTALIVGSVVPDAESYLRMYAEKDLTHSWAGFFLFGLPFGLLMCFVFHNVVRNPLIENLPSFFYRKFSRFTTFNWNKRFREHWLIVILSLVIGGASHFLWDSFSHFDGWLFRQYPALNGNIMIQDRLLEIPYLIQYISTLLGVLILLFFIIQLPSSNKKRTSNSSWKFWLFILVVATIILIPRKIKLPVNSMDDMMIAIISACGMALILVSLIFDKKSESRVRDSGV